MQCLSKCSQGISSVVQCTRNPPRALSTHGGFSCNNVNKLCHQESFQASRHCDSTPRTISPCFICLRQSGCCFKALNLTAENPQDTLAHLSTITMLPYHSSIKLESLSYSQELWEKCRHNLNVQLQDIPSVTFDQLHLIYPEEPHPSGLTHCQHFGAWKYLVDLIEFRSPYFQKYKLECSRCGPETI